MKKFTALVAIVLLPIVYVGNGCGNAFETGLNAELSSSSSTSPGIVVTNAPAPLTNSRDVNLQIEVALNKYASLKSILCTLDGAAPVDCKNGFSKSGLTDGDHTLRIQAIDSFDNPSEASVVLWKIDTIIPVVTFNQAPPTVSGSANVIANFTANEVSTLECALDAIPYATCVSPLAMNNLAKGNHTLKVRAKDSAGNVSVELISNFNIDLTAPVLTLINKPLSPTNATTAAFTFSGTDDGVAITIFSCQLDNQVAVACNNGSVNYANISEGSHTFRFTGRDSAGNTSAAVTYTWFADLTAPALPTIITNVTNPTKAVAASFQFSSTDVNGIKNYNCQLDMGAIEVCTPNITKSYTNLSSASHVFKVQAVDNAGNSSAFANFSWVADNVVPTIAFSQQPANPTSNTAATFVFMVQDSLTSISALECQLDGGAFTACTSPRNISGLSFGSHTFVVRATDAVLNKALSSTTWTVSSVVTPPQEPVTYPKDGFCGLNNWAWCEDFDGQGMNGRAEFAPASSGIHAHYHSHMTLTGTKCESSKLELPAGQVGGNCAPYIQNGSLFLNAEDGGFGLNVLRVEKPFSFAGREGRIHFRTALKGHTRMKQTLLISPVGTNTMADLRFPEKNINKERALVVQFQGDGGWPFEILSFNNGLSTSNGITLGIAHAEGPFAFRGFPDYEYGKQYDIDLYVSRTRVRMTMDGIEIFNQLIDVGFDVGYVFFGQLAYNPLKDPPAFLPNPSGEAGNRFLWDNFAFDGPSLSKNSLTPADKKVVLFRTYGKSSCTVRGMPAETPFDLREVYDTWRIVVDKNLSVSLSDIQCTSMTANGLPPGQTVDIGDLEFISQ